MAARRSSTIGIVLAAGRGRRFWPYSVVRSKPCFPICNEPLVARLVRQFHSVGVKRVFVVTGPADMGERAALTPWPDTAFAVSEQDAGSSPAILAAIAAIGAIDPDDRILVAAGDVVASTPDIAATLRLVAADGAAAGALITPVQPDSRGDWICAEPGEARPGGGVICLSVEGHGRDHSHRLAGIYALHPAAIDYLRTQPPHMRAVPVGGMPPHERDVSDAIHAMLQDRPADVALHVAADATVDVDKPWHIVAATHAVLAEMAGGLQESSIDPSARVDDSAEIDGPIAVGPGAVVGRRAVIAGPAWIGPGARVVNGAIVERGCMIGRGTRVSDYCLLNGGSVMGAECILGHGGEFEGVMLDRSYIYHYSEIYGVLGLNVDIGAGTVCGTLRFDDGDTEHRINGRRERPGLGANCTYFGDYSRTGVGVVTQPGVKIGTMSCVGAGVVVYDDVPDRKLILVKQELASRDWGPDRYGW